MTAFASVRAAALQGRLTDYARPHADYLASDAFVARSALDAETAEGHADRVSATHYLLERVALHPLPVRVMVRNARQGAISLLFFGIDNPVPAFSVRVGSSEHVRLLEAMLDNVESRMFDAAERAIFWTCPEMQEMRELWEMRVAEPWRDRYEALLPTEAERNADPQAARGKEAKAAAWLSGQLQALRARRDARIARIAAVAAPADRQAFLEAMAVDLFCRV